MAPQIRKIIHTDMGVLHAPVGQRASATAS
jgi:hypothetical protein